VDLSTILLDVSLGRLCQCRVQPPRIALSCQRQGTLIQENAPVINKPETTRTVANHTVQEVLARKLRVMCTAGNMKTGSTKSRIPGWSSLRTYGGRSDERHH